MPEESSKREAPAPAAPAWAAEWAVHFMTVAISLGALWLLAVICYATISFDVDHVREMAAPYTFQREFVAPEPAERTAYIAALLLLPCLMLLLHAPLRKRVSTFTSNDLWIRFGISCLALLAALGLGGLGDGFFYWKGCLAYTQPDKFLLATGAVTAVWVLHPAGFVRPAMFRWLTLSRNLLLAAAVAAFIGATSLLRVFPASDPYVADNHFEAVLFASTQVAVGKTLLVDAPHQYGLYPEFLAPLFRALGGISVLRFTSVMAVLQIVVYGLWLAALLRVMRKPWMAMLTFLGAFSLVSFLVPLHVIDQKFIPYYDPYFQYFPVRSLFPAIALFAMSWMSANDRFDSRRLRYFVSVTLGAGTLWNMDAGIPALGAWILYLCHTAIVRRAPQNSSILGWLRAAAPIGAEALIAACTAVGIILLSLAWKAGAWPDLTMSLRFQSVFYAIGFYMLPMRVIHSWVAWAMVVMAALSFGLWSLSQRRSGDDQPSLRSTVFGWAVMACGLFSYFQGRSHDWVFPVLIPFALVFVGLAIDRLLIPAIADTTTTPQWRWASGVVSAAFVVVMVSGAASALRPGGLLQKVLTERWQGLTAPRESSPGAEAIAFVKQRLKPGDTAFILSNHAGVYHAESQTRSVLPTSLGELFVKSDRDALLQKLEEAETVFVDHSVLGVNTPNTNPETNVLLCEQLARHFKKVLGSPGGYLFELKNTAEVTAAGEERVP